MKSLPSEVCRRFECDCVEHVLPVLERHVDDDGRPRHAIETARRFFAGDASLDELVISRKHSFLSLQQEFLPTDASTLQTEGLVGQAHVASQ
ncbi:putative immunity protein [Stieleria varia]|uniref:Imm-5-like domain-containing protein n=1 Tax=Stieleria varia TaxID=2528005 RepID=A0A5C5ZYB9_9BACT|nr:hypothetical protein Pla52n_64580 [Stieleria varia]